MENIETWMITIVIVVFGLISQLAINKYQNGEFKSQIKRLFEKQDIYNKFMNENIPVLNHFSKTEDEMRHQAIRQGESITTLKEKVSQAPSMKEVRDEFVSKEMFKQLEKHMDGQFVILQDGQTQILQELRRIK